MGFSKGRAFNPLLLLFLLAAAAITALVYRYHLAQQAAIAREVRNQLQAIADIKVKNIESWRLDKLNAGRTVMANGLTLAGVERLVKGRSGAEERAAITEWLLGLCRELSCAGMTVTNARGEAVFTHGRTFSGPSHFQELTQRVLD